MENLINAAVKISMGLIVVGGFLMEIMNFPNLTKERVKYEYKKIRPLSAQYDIKASLHYINKVYSEYFNARIGRVNYYIFVASAAMFAASVILVIKDVFV